MKVLSDRIICKYIKFDDEENNEDSQKLNRLKLDSILDEEIWFSSPMKFNDPFDARINLKGIPGLNEKLGNLIAEFFKKKNLNWQNFNNTLAGWGILSELGPILPSFTESFYSALCYKPNLGLELIAYLKKEVAEKYFIEFINFYEKLGISCFADHGFNPMMWHLYSGGNNGICLMYCIDHTEFNNTDIEFISMYYKNQVRTRKDYFEFLPIKDVILNELGVKGKFWRGESELRLVSLNDSDCSLRIPGIRNIGICFSENFKFLTYRDELKEKRRDIKFYHAKNDNFKKIKVWTPEDGEGKVLTIDTKILESL